MYRQMEPAQIVGMATLSSATMAPRVVFEVVYADGKTDYIPAEPRANYQLLTADEMRYGTKTAS